MAFVVKNWQNYPNQPYLVDGPAMQDLETRLSNYTDTLRYFGSWYYTGISSATVAGSAYYMPLDTTVGTIGMSTAVGGTGITFANKGFYNIQFSAQINANNVSGQGQANMFIWLRQNGVDVPWSNTQVYVTKNDPYLVTAWNWIASANANDIFQIMWSTDVTGVVLFSSTTPGTGLTAGYYGPNIPAIIITAEVAD